MNQSGEHQLTTISAADEDLEVGGSNPSPRTNLPATKTPPWLARQMVAIAEITNGNRVLEPSAGHGPLVALALARGAYVTCFELNERLHRKLSMLPRIVAYHADFLEAGASPMFDAVLMNPPMNALPHVVKAYEFLKVGGRLVALLHADAAEAAKAHLGGAVRPLPADTFQFDGKPIACALFWVTR